VPYPVVFAALDAGNSGRQTRVVFQGRDDMCFAPQDEPSDISSDDTNDYICERVIFEGEILKEDEAHSYFSEDIRTLDGEPVNMDDQLVLCDAAFEAHDKVRDAKPEDDLRDFKLMSGLLLHEMLHFAEPRTCRIFISDNLCRSGWLT